MLVASRDYIGDIVYISYCERSEGRLAELLFYVFVVGVLSPRKAVGLHGPGSQDPKVPRHQSSDEVPRLAQGSQVTTKAWFLHPTQNQLLVKSDIHQKHRILNA